MRFTPTVLLASCAALSAAAPTKVADDEVVLYGNGRFQKIKRSDLKEVEEVLKSGITPPKPLELEESMYTVSGNATKADHAALSNRDELSKRGWVSIVIPNEPIEFIGWDKPISRTASGGNAEGGTDVTITAGVSQTNRIAAQSGATLSIVKDFLDVSVSVDYSQSWTTSQSDSFSFNIPKGKFGVIVSNAYTHRESGNVWTGDIGGEGSSVYYQADSFTPENKGGMEWVRGFIQPCIKDDWPLTRCIGEGEL